MAINRIEILDPGLIRPGKIDRRIESPLPGKNISLSSCAYSHMFKYLYVNSFFC
jgi:ATP-dependent Zn protease